MSLPTWERGLKSTLGSTAAPPPFVAPYMGAWMEINSGNHQSQYTPVAPYMGAWIEMCVIAACSDDNCVAPYMGAWIEMSKYSAAL